MRESIQTLAALQQQQQPGMLVSIVGSAGSSPRGLGACMVLSSQGRLQGSVGGGAVEYQAERLALELLEQKRSLSRLFSLKKGDVHSIGMVCGGELQLHFQYLPASPALYLLWQQALGALDAGEGGYLILKEDGSQPYLSKESLQNCYCLPLRPWERVFIFGGGHISLPLVPLLKSLAFEVYLMDDREDYGSPLRFPDAAKAVWGDYRRISEYFSIGKEDYALVLTHGHSFDKLVEKQLLMGEFAYLGVIGSRSKTAELHRQLLEEGVPASQLDRVHTPVGLAIGAVTPEEIAVSIAAELIKVRADRRKEQGIELKKSCPMH